MVVFISCLDNSKKKLLKAEVNKLGKSEWAIPGNIHTPPTEEIANRYSHFFGLPRTTKVNLKFFLHTPFFGRHKLPLWRRYGSLLVCFVFPSWITNEFLKFISDTYSKYEVVNIRITNIPLGGYIVNEWQKQCTHLVMDALSFTVKVGTLIEIYNY